jgi:hypothetical protein
MTRDDITVRDVKAAAAGLPSAAEGGARSVDPAFQAGVRDRPRFQSATRAAEQINPHEPAASHESFLSPAPQAESVGGSRCLA